MTARSSISILTFLMLFAHAGFSQSVSYTVKEDNPDYANLFSSINFFTTDISATEFASLGWGIESNYIGNAKWGARAWYDRSFLGINTSSSRGEESGAKTRSFFESGAYYKLKESSSKSSNKVVLSGSQTTNSSGYTQTETNFIMVPTTVKRMVLARSGIFAYRTAFDNEDFDDILLNDQKVTGRISDYIPGENEWIRYVSNVRAVGNYSGFAIASKRRIVIEADGYKGVRTKTKFSQFYVDAFIAPFVGLGEYADNAGQIGTDGESFALNKDGDNGHDVSHLGWRVGYFYNQSLPKAKRLLTGLHLKFEAGQRPGIKGGEWYGLFGMGVAINSKI